MITRTILTVVCVLAVLVVLTAWKINRALGADTVVAAPSTQPAAQSPLSFTMKDVDGKDVNLADYKGKVVMLVNVASKCGYTKKDYPPLEAIYKKYKDQGFVIIGFPANNFGHQEPGTDSEIKQFCTGTYNVTFPIMSKISVKGDDIAPLYKFLTESQTDGQFAGEIGWNFTKFLVDRNGQVMARFATKVPPDDAAVTGAIETALAAK